MYFTDNLLNLTTGLGTQKDRVTETHFVHSFLGQQELDAMYTSNWIAGKIIDAPADDMTREWRSWDAGPKHTKAIQLEEARLNVRGKVNRVLKLARLYGGAALFMGVANSDPSLPLDPNTVDKGGLQFLQVLSRHDCVTGAIDRDPLSPYYGEPTYYELHSPTYGSVMVHPSRVIRFYGQAHLDVGRSFQGWGLSTLQRVYEAVKDAAITPHAVALLAQEAKVNVINVPGLTQNSMDEDYRRKITMRFGLAQAAQGLVNALLLDADEKWSQKTVNPNGWPQVIGSFLEIVAGAGDMPVTRLLGVAPKGLNATGDSDVRNYYDMCSSKQETDMRPTMHRADEVLIRSATGSKNPNANYTWNPLWQLTNAESAAINLQRAQTDDIYASMGVMPADAMRSAIQNKLLQDGIYPGLADILAANVGKLSEPLIAPSAIVMKNAPKTAPAKTVG